MKFAGIIEPGVASGIVTYSKYIQGTYIVVSDYSERDKIPTGVLIEGAPVYISSLKKTQRCHINNKVIEWVDDNASELSVGYYFEDKFYSDAEHTDEIEALQDKLYVDLGKNDLYIYHGGYICLTEVKVDKLHNSPIVKVEFQISLPLFILNFSVLYALLIHCDQVISLSYPKSVYPVDLTNVNVPYSLNIPSS